MGYSLRSQPKIVAFADTFLGKILTVLLFALGLFLLQFPYWHVISVCIGAIVFYEKRRFQFFLIGGLVLATLFSGGYFLCDKAFVLACLDFSKILKTENTILSLALDVLMTALIFLVSWIFIKIYENKSSKGSAIFSLGLFFVLIVFVDHLLGDSYSAKFLLAFIVFFSKVFWPLLYLIYDYAWIKDKNTFRNLASLIPFWSQWALVASPVPRGYLELETKFKENKDLAATRLSGLQLLYWLLVLNYLAIFIQYFCFGGTSYIDPTLSKHFPTLDLPNYYREGFAYYNKSGVPLSERWFAIFVFSFTFIMKGLAVGTGVVVAMARMCGLPLFRHTYKPYQATSFNDFFRRIFFYYNELVIKFFFFPLLPYAGKFISNKRWRLGVTTFVAVLISAWVIHYTRDVQNIVYSGFYGSLLLSLKRSPYYFGLALFSSISAAYTFGRKKEKSSFLVHSLRLFLIFVCYSLCLAVQANYERDSWQDRVTFIASLFNIYL